jgi:hypothetical protein
MRVNRTVKRLEFFLEKTLKERLDPPPRSETYGTVVQWTEWIRINDLLA